MVDVVQKREKKTGGSERKATIKQQCLGECGRVHMHWANIYSRIGWAVKLKLYDIL